MIPRSESDRSYWGGRFRLDLNGGRLGDPPKITLTPTPRNVRFGSKADIEPPGMAIQCDGDLARAQRSR